MRKTFVAAAVLPLAVTMGIDSYYKMKDLAPSNPNYNIVLQDKDCRGKGPFVRMSIENEGHITIYDFQPPKSMAEIRKLVREIGYDPNKVKPFVCE